MTTVAVQVKWRPAVVYRPESYVYWLYLAALLVGVISLIDDQGAMIVATLGANIALAPVWLLFMAALIWVMLRFDPYRSVRAYPQALLAGTALGGTTALAIAMQGNTALEQVWSAVLKPETLAAWSAALTAPIIEEAAKAMCAAVILVLCASVFNRVSHALLVGMFVGFGFDIMEDLGYASSSAITSLDSDLAGAGGQLGIRIFTAFPAHWSYTALTAVGVLLLLGSFANPDQWTAGRRLALAAGLLASGPLMHFIWDSPVLMDTGGQLLVKVVLNSAIFLPIAIWLVGTERRWMCRRIDGHPDLVDGVSPELLAALTSWQARRRLVRQTRHEGGRAAARAARREQRAVLDALQAP